MWRLLVSLFLSTAALASVAATHTRSAFSPGTGARVQTFHAIRPVHYVNPFIGTFGDGNVFPGADTPFGMVQWSPDTGPSGITRPGGYFYRDAHITGFPLTHLSGAGCVQYDDVPFMPVARSITVSPVSAGFPYSARFRHNQESASPGYYQVRLDSGIDVELSATTRTGIARFTYPGGAPEVVVINAGGSAGARTNRNGAVTASVRILDTHQIVGSATSGHFCGQQNTYTVYFAARFDRSFLAAGTWRSDTVSPGVRSTSGPLSGAYVRLQPGSGLVVTARVGISFVSVGNALLNLREEDAGKRFSAVHTEARRAWNQALNAVRIEGGAVAQRVSFYTALYHSMLYPNMFSDANGQYAGFDGRVHSAGGAPQYANYSGWDIYRSQIPLLALLAPTRASDMMQSLVRDAQQTGWLPRWPVANDDSGVMNGDSADPILASAYAFGARHFDAREALRFMVHGATVSGPGPHSLLERPGLHDYLRLGYLPPQPHAYGSAATTLEYTADDFAIAQLAGRLGFPKLRTAFMRRSEGWRHLLNPATGFLEPAAADGSFPRDFHPRSESGFVEGSAWQYRWAVPYNLPGLFAAMGGETPIIARLNHLFLHLNTDAHAPYYWAGNEMDLEAPWEYDFTREPWRTQAVVRRIVSTLFPATTYGLPGNDDLGEISSWYVFAAMGLYPEIPCVGGLALSSPLFPRIDLRLGEGRSLTLLAPGASTTKPFIHGIRVDGKTWNEAWLPLSALSGHAVVRFDPHPRPLFRGERGA